MSVGPQIVHTNTHLRVGSIVGIASAMARTTVRRFVEMATTGNAAVDPHATDDWWTERGARRVEVEGAWQCGSPDELERILRVEFPDDVVDRFLSGAEPSETITYRFALFVVGKAAATETDQL
jgi:hypothetical protein